MSENQTVPPPKDLSTPEKEAATEAVSKYTFRKKIWHHFVKNNISAFPSPFGRIPNFKGAEQAAEKLLELDEFKAAKYVEVNPDKPLEYSRILVLKSEKELFVPIPRLRENLLKKLTLQDDMDVKRLVSFWGIENTGTEIGLNENIHIDLFVLGSVAVSKEGYRIGKGKGYADLEYAILREMKAIDNKTVIVTTVHDSQVFDELPADLFKNYDVPVDYIVTPNKVLKTTKNIPKPEGIFWNVLSEKRLKSMIVLQQLREKHNSEGKDTTLKEVESDTEEGTNRVRKYYRRKRSFKKKKPEKNSSGDAAGDKPEIKPEGKNNRQRRVSMKSKNEKGDEEKSAGTTENNENIPPRKQRKRSRQKIDFSLHVSNIKKNVRVRDFKVALSEKGIRPDNITWKGFKGYCFLHYALKSNRRKGDETQKGDEAQKGDEVEKEKEPFAVDSVIDILKNLNLDLEVKVVEPITRIETTDVTTV